MAMLIDTASVAEGDHSVAMPLAASSAGQEEQLLSENIRRLRSDITTHLHTYAHARAIGNEVAAMAELRSLDNLRKNLQSLQECREILQATSEVSRKRQIATSGGGLALSRKDLPKFQLVSSFARPFPHEEVFESAEHFLKTFEKVVASAGRDVELVWKSFFPLCLPNSEDAWYETEMKQSCDI